MKNIKISYLLALLMLSSSLVFGQKHTLDSICVQIDDNIEINLAIYNYSKLVSTVEKDFIRLQSILKDSKDIPEKASYTIDYKADELLSIKQTEPGERIIWENGKQTRYQFNNQCKMSANAYLLKIQFNDLENILSDSLLAKLKKVIDTTRIIQKKYASTYNYSFQGENLIHNSQLDKRNGQTDVLVLKGGIGANLIKNQPIIDIAAELGLIFSKKGILKNQYYLGYNLLFDFDANDEIKSNGFLSIGYRYNLSKNMNDSNWLGVELGYLVSKNGDLFGDNTFRLGVNWEVGKYISVSPQLYLSNDFKDFYPAIRIGFGF